MIAFWIALALITGAVLLLLVMPLLRGARGPVDQATYDLAVYKDQLKEVDRDRERGLLSNEEAAAARLEIERRILAVAPVEKAAITAKGKQAKGREKENATGSTGLSRAARIAGIVSMVIVPAGALVIYGYLGSPGLPDQPHAERMAERMDMDQPGRRRDDPAHRTVGRPARSRAGQPAGLGHARAILLGTGAL